MRADDLVNDPDDNPHERLIQKLLRIKARLERERAEEEAASAEKQGGGPSRGMKIERRHAG